MTSTATKPGTAVVPTTQEILQFTYPDTVYKRDVVWSGGINTDAESRRSIVSPGFILLGIDSYYYNLSTSSVLDLNTAGNWNSSETTYATAANRAGKDVYIYLCSGSGDTLNIVLSCDSSFPDDYTALTSRQIGGFHCLCVSAGATPGDALASHPAANYLAGDIIPNSVWDLLFRSHGDNIGEAWIEELGIWTDIYMLSSGGSVYTGNPLNQNWEDTADSLAVRKKKFLNDYQFQIVAARSNEETNIHGSADVSSAGGHLDTDSKRMISKYFLEECCGYLNQWLSDTTAKYDGAVTAGYVDLGGSSTPVAEKGSSYLPVDTNEIKLLAGGHWNNAAACGSRSRCAGYSRSNATSNFGARGCSDPRIVNL